MDSQGDGSSHGALPMFKLKSLLIIGVSAVAVGAAAIVSGHFGAFVGVAGASAETKPIANSVERTRKSDRMTVAHAARGETRTISAVEVVGIRDAAIIYRDRDGRVLYQSDPLNNVTLVTKGVVLPEVTLRETANSIVRPVTATVPAKPAQPSVESREPQKPSGATPRNGSNERRPRIPEGCDAAASPIAAPQLSHILAKCLT